MKNYQVYFIAVLICLCIFAAYIMLNVELELKRGGGIFAMLITLSLMGTVWRLMTRKLNKANTENKEEIDESISDMNDNASTKEGEAVTDSSDEITNSVIDGCSKTAPLQIETAATSLYTQSTSEFSSNMTESVKEVIDEHSKTEFDNKTTYDYHIALKVILVLFIVTSVASMINQFATNMIWENHLIGTIQIVGALINLVAFILIFNKKLSGLIVFYSMLLLQIPLNIILGSQDIDSIILSSVIRAGIISLVLLIPKKGVTGWTVLTKKYNFKTDTPTSPLNTTSTKDEYCESQSNTQINDDTISKNKEDIIDKSMKSHPSLTEEEKGRKRSKYFHFGKILVVFISSLLFIIIIVFTLIISFRSYPDYIQRFPDKVMNYFSLSNNRLAKDLINKAQLAHEKELTELEETYFDAAYNVGTNDFNSLVLLADYFNGKDNDKAIDLLLRALDIEKNAELYSKLSWCYSEDSTFVSAIFYAQKALELDSLQERAYITLYKVNYIQNNWDECRKWAHKAINLTPNEGQHYYVLAKALYENGEKSTARYYYNKAIELDPEHWLRKQLDKIGGIPFVINSISVSNTTGDGRILNNYGSVLYDESIRYLKPKIAIYPLRIGDFKIYYKLFINGIISSSNDSPSGYTYSTTININDLEDKTIELDGWGSDNSLHDAGVHRFEFWYEGIFLGSKTFNVYSMIHYRIYGKNRLY